jgi:hypothetical protein
VKGALALAIAVLLLPGSVIMLLSANFGVLKGYLIGGAAFFGFVFVLSLIWTFGLPGTPALTGPKGTDPSFKPFAQNSATATKYSAVQQFQGAASNGWKEEPAEPVGGAKLPPDQETLRGDLETAKQAVVQTLITDTNKNVKDSSKELDVTNLDQKVFYTNQNGTELVAVVVTGKQPPAGSGLEKPSFAPKTFFSFRDPGAPYVPSLLVMGISLVLFLGHMLGLGAAERARPLGRAPRAPEETAAPVRAPAR